MLEKVVVPVLVALVAGVLSWNQIQLIEVQTNLQEQASQFNQTQATSSFRMQVFDKVLGLLRDTSSASLSSGEITQIVQLVCVQDTSFAAQIASVLLGSASQSTVEETVGDLLHFSAKSPEMTAALSSSLTHAHERSIANSTRESNRNRPRTVLIRRSIGGIENNTMVAALKSLGYTVSTGSLDENQNLVKNTLFYYSESEPADVNVLLDILEKSTHRKFVSANGAGSTAVAQSKQYDYIIHYAQ